MKKKLLSISLATILAMSFTGCSKPCEPEIKIIKTPKTVFIIPDINVSSIKNLEPKDIKVSSGVVTTSLKTFKAIHTQTSRYHIQRDIYKTGFDSLREQIIRYNKNN